VKKATVWLIIIAAAIGPVGAAAAYLGSIVNSWDARHILGPTEGTYPFGVAYDNGYLWVSCGNYILKRLPSDGSIVKSVHTLNRSIGDMGFDNSRRYLYGHTLSAIGVIEADTGRIVELLQIPPGAETGPSIAFSREAATPLWVASPVEPVVWRMTAQGNIVASYVPQFPCYYINGLAYAETTPVGRVLFAGQQYMSVPSRIFALRPRDGSILYSFISPLPQNTLTDLTWDGKYLWGIHVVRSGGPNTPAYIYQFVATTDVAVTPASIGRVKAIYR
jgi:hypothetical protein